MIRTIIKIPSTPPIDIAIMDNRGLDEWPGVLPPNCVEEVVVLCCVEEAVASDGVGGAVITVILVSVEIVFEVGDAPMGVDIDELDWVVCVGCGVVPAGLITGAVDPGGQPNAAQGSTKQQPLYPILSHVQY